MRGAVGIFIASIPLLAGVPNAQLYFDVGFVVVLVSLLVQGWTIAPAARALKVAFPRSDPLPRRVELDLPGQLEQEMVGYPHQRQQLLSAARFATDLGAADAGRARRANPRVRRRRSRCGEGDYIYLLAPPEKAQALDRFFVDMPPPARPDPLLLGDFFVTGDHTLGELAEIYGLSIAPEELSMSLADFIAARTVRTPRAGDIVPLGAIALVVHKVTKGRVTSIGLRLAEELEPENGAGDPMGTAQGRGAPAAVARRLVLAQRTAQRGPSHATASISTRQSVRMASRSMVSPAGIHGLFSRRRNCSV